MRQAGRIPAVRLRYNPVHGWGALALGVSVLLVCLIDGRWILAITPAFVTVMGASLLTGTRAIVEADEVRVRNAFQITIKRVRIRGLADLRLRQMKLYRVSDGKKIVNLGWDFIREADMTALRQAIAAAEHDVDGT